MNGVSFVTSCDVWDVFLRRRGRTPPSPLSLPPAPGSGTTSEAAGYGTYSNSAPSPLITERSWLRFPLEKSLARAAVAGPGARRCTRNRREESSAVRVSEGRRALNEIMGSGCRVTVLKEEIVIPLA